MAPPSRALGRLRRGADVARVRRTGRRVTGAFVALHVLPGHSGSRAAFVCGRHVGGAVTRNRARRLLREAWRAIAARLNGDWEVVLVARPGIVGAGAAEVAADLAASLSSAGAIA